MKGVLLLCIQIGASSGLEFFHRSFYKDIYLSNLEGYHMERC